MGSRRRIAAGSVALAVAAVSLYATAPTFARGERAEPQRFDVVLGLKRHQQDLNRFARKVARPVSPKYGQYLSAQQVGRRFGAGRHLVHKVRFFLRRRGIESQVDVTRSFVEALAGPGKTRRLFGRPNGNERVPQHVEFWEQRDGPG